MHSRNLSLYFQVNTVFPTGLADRSSMFSIWGWHPTKDKRTPTPTLLHCFRSIIAGTTVSNIWCGFSVLLLLHYLGNHAVMRITSKSFVCCMLRSTDLEAAAEAAAKREKEKNAPYFFPRK